MQESGESWVALHHTAWHNARFVEVPGHIVTFYCWREAKSISTHYATDPTVL